MSEIELDVDEVGKFKAQLGYGSLIFGASLGTVIGSELQKISYAAVGGVFIALFIVGALISIYAFRNPVNIKLKQSNIAEATARLQYSEGKTAEGDSTGS